MLDTASWTPADSVVFAPLDDEVALLDTTRNVYYALAGIGPFLWQGIADGLDFAALCRKTTETFDVDPDTARADTASWLENMLAAGLIAERRD